MSAISARRPLQHRVSEVFILNCRGKCLRERAKHKKQLLRSTTITQPVSSGSQQLTMRSLKFSLASNIFINRNSSLIVKLPTHEPNHMGK